MKKVLAYGLALIIGVLLTVIATPYARAHRADPSLVGGEVFLPVFPVIVCTVLLEKKKDREKEQ